ncbi:hypothetical protein KAJ61_05960 [Candidatus Parcubacteria bacterium]|nr:hypothetical protein [Candidatus Parcubacteria bacterium]
MRQVLSISLQENIIKDIKKRVKNGCFKSVSEYFKYLFKMDTEDVISEKELMKDIIQARKEYKEGKTIKANSLADLL